MLFMRLTLDICHPKGVLYSHAVWGGPWFPATVGFCLVKRRDKKQNFARALLEQKAVWKAPGGVKFAVAVAGARGAELSRLI